RLCYVYTNVRMCKRSAASNPRELTEMAATRSPRPARARRTPDARGPIERRNAWVAQKDARAVHVAADRRPALAWAIRYARRWFVVGPAKTGPRRAYRVTSV